MPQRAVVTDARDDLHADVPATHDLVRPVVGKAGRSPDRDA